MPFPTNPPDNEFKVLWSPEDFQQYKDSLDRGDGDHATYLHDHHGEPNTYPCIVESEFWDDPNGPYTYFHSFEYKETIVRKARAFLIIP